MCILQMRDINDKSTCLLVESLGELIDTWGDLQTLVEHFLLPLKTNVLRPANIASKVTLRLNVTTYTNNKIVHQFGASNFNGGISGA